MANWKYGSSSKGLKIRKPGNYDHGTFKITIILAVETGNPAVPDGLIGLVSNPCIWAHVTNEPGTSVEVYHIFVEHVLGTYNAIENLAFHQTLIHDNLTLHKVPKVYQAVCQHSHCIVCHPPYQPQDEPIKYAINKVCGHLENGWSEVTDLVSMTMVIIDIINNNIHNMDDTFVHCGYVWNEIYY